MSNSKKQETMNNDDIINCDDINEIVESEVTCTTSVEIVESHDLSTAVDFSAGTPIGNGGNNGSRCLTSRLNEILVEEGDGDLLMQETVRESSFMQWFQALDFQHIGACRVDERLKPLLQINASTGAASEDCLLSHLSKYFEPSEVGLLARCLFVPLVSMRVGKVEKQGSMLFPTSVRGHLSLTLLPSSDLRVSFIGDDGMTERLATLSDTSEYSAVTVEEIPADLSGRSFLMKLPDGETIYFWCSENSMLVGCDLLLKMKDLLMRKPTLTELTGISESRLERFATHLRSFLVGPNFQATSTALSSPWTDIGTNFGENTQSSSTAVKPMRTRQSGGIAIKGHTQYQGSLSPRPSLFKETSLRSISREKIRRRGDFHLPVGSTKMTEAILNISEKVNPSEAFTPNSISSLSFPESLRNCSVPESPNATIQIPPLGAFLSPYYCWCPPCTTPTMAPISKLPTSLAEPFSLPPLSTLLPSTGTPSMLQHIPPLDLASKPTLEFPSFLSDPLTRLSFANQSTQLPIFTPLMCDPFANQSTQLPIFTPLMCDPIVHIPVLDVCSSGQGYLVSAGPGIATNIPSLHPKLVGPMMSESESMVDKGARETLRLLIGGSSSIQSSASLMGVFPAVLNDENKQGVIVAGSRGLYSGISDVNAIVNSFAAVGLTSVSERSTRAVGLKSCCTASDVIEHTSSSLDFQDSAFMPMDEENN